MSKKSFKTRQKQQNYEAPLHDEEAAMDFVDDIPEIPKESKLKKFGRKVKATAKMVAKPVANIAATGAIAGVACYGIGCIYCLATGRELYMVPKDGICVYETVIHDVATKLAEVSAADAVDTVKEVAEAASEEI